MPKRFFEIFKCFPNPLGVMFLKEDLAETDLSAELFMVLSLLTDFSHEFCSVHLESPSS